MDWREELPYLRAPAILVTQHGKEHAIGPALQRDLGLRLETSRAVDTDRFGAFTGEIERRGSPLDAARAKIEAGFAAHPWARIGVASEGSFGPHPAIPFVALARELILMVDRETGDQWTGHDVSPRTNYATAEVVDLAGARAFAERTGFPSHGVVVMAYAAGRPAPELGLWKAISSPAELDAAVTALLERRGSAFLQTDMRADRNPTRQRAIERATADLVRRFRSRCPACSYPGYDVRSAIAGLPCRACAAPTPVVMAHVYVCTACAFTEERRAGDPAAADPQHCGRCNP